MYVITGVTGNTGAVVADTLLTAGKPVRVVVRDAARAAPWRARGAEVAVAALEDTAALTAALRGATGAYLLVPPRLASADPAGENRAVVASLAAATRAAAVPHAVLLSSIGAQHPDGTGPIATLHHAEAALAEVTALTAVRAAYFMENWGASLGAVAQGALPTFLPRALAIPMIATRDIGTTAAATLVEGPGGERRRVLELAGPRPYSADDVAAAVAAITGQPVAAAEAPLDAVVPTFTRFGVSAAMAALYREMYAAIIAGRVDWEGGAARAVRGPTPLQDVLRTLLAR
ncbi:MAG: NmrA family NAD(P)-binding protein [Kofleriaceae bacterium]|nr:NmrA family NAD(P)-binding protein [Kofleriaceae bacterium]MCL4224462.1 NmrA family NAD(P)-binding protein [Myxococcales bacterium]